MESNMQVQPIDGYLKLYQYSLYVPLHPEISESYEIYFMNMKRKYFIGK